MQNTAKREAENVEANENDDADLEFLIDANTGKKMPKKKILQQFQSGAFNAQQIAELEKRGYLQ